jgi:hypothetical protein
MANMGEGWTIKELTHETYIFCDDGSRIDPLVCACPS